jgi:hypothetical protein
VDLFVRRLEAAYSIDWLIVYGLRGGAYGMFFVDILLFGTFLVRTTKVELKETWRTLKRD